MPGRWFAVSSIALALLGLGALLAFPRPSTSMPVVTPPSTEVAPPPVVPTFEGSEDALAARPEGTIAWIAIGGGAEPESSQVSLEQDLGLLGAVLDGPGLVLFAGGARAAGVQELRKKPAGDPLRADLADLFDPRPGRDTFYRAPAIHVDGPARRQTLSDALSLAARESELPLFVYLAAHGEPGDLPRDNVVRLWGGNALSASGLAEELDALDRPVRLVVTSCYAGGFAEVAFESGDFSRPPTSRDRCGLFATTWDEEASGCDPDPERGRQQGYGLHFLHALRGEDRYGAPLDLESLDLDRDGRVSLLEAHTRARIASGSIDVPTTTSERWLRHVAPSQGPEAPVAMPEEDAVVQALEERLAIATEADARRRLRAIERALDEAQHAMVLASERSDDAYHELRIGLLERWPVLDDPWHPDFEATLHAHRREIERFLFEAETAVAYRRAQDALENAAAAYEEHRVTRSILRRLVRAYDTRILARRVRAKGGRAWSHFEKLRTCERSVPRAHFMKVD